VPRPGKLGIQEIYRLILPVHGKSYKKNFPKIWPNRFVSQDTHKIRKNQLSRPLTFVYDDFFFPAKKFKKLFLEITVPVVAFAIF
jgi:hypothetical protein